MATIGVVSTLEVYQDLVLYITPEKFYIEPLESPSELLVLDRVTREITLQGNSGQIPHSATSKPICGLVGIITLLAGPYLIVITKKSKVGDINGQPIWKLEDTEILSYSRTLLHLTDEQVQFNKTYLSMVQSVLQTPHFYFSYTYDLTHTLQRLFNTSPDFLEMSLFERADHRFVWNAHVMRELSSKQGLQRYCLPLMHGFVAIKRCLINQKPFMWILVSRRSCQRAGARLFMRGSDSEGQVANFVETEQIVEYDGARSSFVQTRGSIPLFWNQLPNLKFKPNPVISNNQNHLDAFQRHFESQVIVYGKQVLINLIDHKGPEDKLEKKYADLVHHTNHPLIRYESFDYHHECRGMRVERLSLLMDRLAQDQDEFGYFLMLRDGSVACQQDGVFRTNCIDCLDRTNVVQSLLARRSLQQQLQRLGVLNPGQRVEDQVMFEMTFKEVWADNADFCSIQYSGTGALKTDFTRTGKRTKMGLLLDGVNSLIRYYKNNFTDGFRQDSIDLFLGSYQVEEAEGVEKFCPLTERRDWRYLVIPILGLIALAIWFFCLFFRNEHIIETILYSMFWASMVAACVWYIFRHGPEYVDYPKLRDLHPRVNLD